ncbi:C-C motif chemokine 19 [Xenopus tropicalis]|uniref:C-C motif chemokine n=1 Tax=Xenopus tropicalis TaxID=8364 RepID=A0A6I8SFK3_XENTR|nr:C-C motif chemokine 19 [Xenopus tropicalis]
MRPIWTLLPLAVLTALLWDTADTQGTGNIVADCCLKTSDKRIPPGAVRAYQLQSRSNGCTETAIVFITKSDKRLCAPPQLKWVRKLIEKLDKAGKKSLKRKSPPSGAGGKRSRGDLPADG